MNLSLRNKLLLPIVTVIVLGMVLATTLQYRGGAKALQTTINDQLDALTISLSKQVSSWLEDLKKDVEIQSHQAVYSNLLWSEGNDRSMALRSSEALKNFSESYGIYETVAVTNREGLVVASSVEGQIGQLDVGDRRYFKESMNGRPFLSKILVSKVSQKPIFVISVPVKVDDEISGILLASVKLSAFADEFIAPVKVGESGYAYMADKEGLLIAHPDPKTIMKTNIKDYDWGQELFEKGQGHMTYTFNGLEKLVSFDTVPQTGWLIGAGASTDEVFSEVVALRNQGIIVALLVVLGAVAVIVFILRPIVGTINQGVGLAQKIQQGDVSQRLNLDRGDEIGQLATALDTMADGLQDRASLASTIADGDLRGQVTLASEKDTLGHALSEMTQKLNTILGQINIAGEQIDSGAGQVSDSAQELSHGATQQAAAIEEIGASMSELASQTKQNAENAGSANQLAAEARGAADRGASQMQQMVAAMGEINEAGQDIGKIIKTIDEIAFQTNLLALNAAVEAARAGQHGKGFAVVAEEVRNLAARSAKAASETAELIEGSIKKGENGANIAGETAASLDEIVAAITKTTDLVSEIAAASNEQAEGIGQVNDGISQIDQVIQKNTASAEEGAAAAEELSSQATHLRQMIAQFKLQGQAGANGVAASFPDTEPAQPQLEAPSGETSGWGN